MSNAHSSRGMVTSPHSAASECGAAVLRDGGNAVEAAIATCAALYVTYPHFCGLGGDVLMLLSDANGKVQAVSGIGQAAQDISGYGSQIPLRGPRSALTSAGAVAALDSAWQISTNSMGGKRSWASLWDAAIGMAGEGYAVSASERFWLAFRQRESDQLRDVFDSFCTNGALPDIGEMRRRPDLARSLQAIATRGARDFYEGQLAAEMVRGLTQAGSPLTTQDLAATVAHTEAPLRMPYRDGTLVSQPPPSQGMSTLQTMGLLRQFDLPHITQGSADHYHLMVEAVKLAFIDRNRYLADPAFANVPVDHLLSASYLATQSQQIDMNHAKHWPHVYQHGDTVYVAACDALGNAASVLATVYFDWGSGVMAGDSGVLWHNRGAAFSTDPTHPNALAAGKRPFHTLNPGMYLKQNKPHILFGTQGADGQPQTLAALLTRLIDHGMDPHSALAAPRFLLGKTFSDSTDNLKIERDVPTDVQHALMQRGHLLSLVDAHSPLMGHPGVIVIDPQSGLMTGAHDPRSDGVAVGL
jgi:gamma-glutamyltranspeptidase